MKNSAKYFIYLLIIIFLTACGKAPIDRTLAPLYTQAFLTARAQLTEAAFIPTATPSVTVTPKPTLTPIISPTAVPIKRPDDVKASLIIETLESFDGHALRRISGWSEGFDGFTWIGEQHLFLYPIIGRASSEHIGGNSWFSYPTILNLNSGKVWLPPTESHGLFFSRSFQSILPRSSTQAGGLLASSDTDTATMVYSLEGDLLKTYQGTLLGVSPSGSKLMLVVENPSDSTKNETKWIDLLNNKEINFDWPESANSYEPNRLIWSADEMKVYATTDFGNFYGNVKTSESYSVGHYPYEGEDENHLIRSPRHSYGTWVLNDKYLLARWNEYYEGTPGYISFFDPAKKAYRNLSALLGLPYLLQLGVNPDPPYPCENGQPSAQNGGRYVWVNCESGGRLIDMQTFKAKAYPYYTNVILEWSADGTFAFFRSPYNDHPQEILSVTSNEVKPISVQAQCETWHPKQNIFVYLSKNKQMLLFFDVRSMSVRQQFTLPRAFHCPKWNKSGSKLTMIAEDKSLWQVDYPSLSHLEQLTGSIKGMDRFVLSPDGTSIAFSAGQDIYIVDTKRKP